MILNIGADWADLDRDIAERDETWWVELWQVDIDGNPIRGAYMEGYDDLILTPLREVR